MARGGEYREQIALMTELSVAKDDEVAAERHHLVDYKRHVALAALNSRSGRPIPPQVGGWQFGGWQSRSRIYTKPIIAKPVKNRVVGCWRGRLSGARCRLAYGSS